MALDNFRRIDMKINRANDYQIETQFAKEGDYNGRELVVQITDAGEVKNQSGVSLNLGWRHDSVGNTGLDHFTVVDITKGIFKIAYPKEMLNAGLVTAVIQVVERGKITLTRNFKITVENNPIDEDAIVSENSFTVLQEALLTIGRYDGKIASLEANKVSQSEFDSWVATLLDGGPSIFMNTLSELRNTYPNGASGVALVRETDPAKIYVWTGSAWEDFGDYQGIEVKDGSVAEDKIANKAVTPKKTNIFNSGSVNFFNKETAKRGQLMPETGEVIFGEVYGYYVSDFIPIENVEEVYTNENINNYAFYDANNQHLNGGNGPIKRLKIPSEVVKLRFSFWNTHLEYFMLSDKVVDKYVSYYTVKNEHLGGIDGSNIHDGTLTYEKTNFLKDGYNLFNPSRVSLGAYVEPISGGLTSNARYNTTDHIEYKAGDAFNATTVRTIAFYDKNYNVLEGKGVAETKNPTNYGFIAPSEAGYMRVSYLAETENFQITKGITPKPYMNPAASLLKDVFVESKNILGGDKDKGEKQKNISTSSSIKAATLVDGEQIKVEQNSIKKNKTLSFHADIDTFSGIRLGHGEGVYGASYIEIDGAEIRLYNKNTNAELQVTFNHGLAVSDFISVFMKVDEESLITIQLITNAGSYKTEPHLWNGYNGSPFAKSLGSIFRNCELVFDSEDYQKPIFAFGDSYVGLTVEDRWPYYIKEYGYDNWLLNGFPGQNSLSAKAMFDSILQKNTPEIVFWALGMNDGDSDSVNQNWLSVYNYVKEYCNANNIELILATIPNTPSINNAYKNDIVRSSGYRYVDFNKAVGADKDVNWYSGMLHTDNVHPTVLGAKQLANRALLDIPELARS